MKNKWTLPVVACLLFAACNQPSSASAVKTEQGQVEQSATMSMTFYDQVAAMIRTELQQARQAHEQTQRHNVDAFSANLITYYEKLAGELDSLSKGKYKAAELTKAAPVSGTVTDEQYLAGLIERQQAYIDQFKGASVKGANQDWTSRLLSFAKAWRDQAKNIQDMIKRGINTNKANSRSNDNG